MPAEKIELRATPARTIASGLTLVILTRRMMIPVARRAIRNALPVTM